MSADERMLYTEMQTEVCSSHASNDDVWWEGLSVAAVVFLMPSTLEDHFASAVAFATQPLLRAFIEEKALGHLKTSNPYSTSFACRHIVSFSRFFGATERMVPREYCRRLR